MLRTNGYFKSYENTDHIEVGHKYYFGELTDGSPAADDSINNLDENNIGAIGETYDENGVEHLVTFKIVENDVDYLDCVVEIVDITEL